jgi:alpha-ketoglutarate-dependent taurine dioxygenase
MAVQTLEVRPLDGPHPQFGAEIDNVDLDNLSDADFETIRNTLYNYHVIVLKNQAGVSPKGRALSKFLFVVKVLTELDSSIRNHQKIRPSL